MAISKVVGGNGFKGALSYIMQKPEASHITQNCVFGATAQEIALEMRLNANQSNLKKPVMHASLSLAPGEKAAPEQLKTLGETWLKGMGYDIDKAQYTITRHSDRDHDHIHVLVNRVQLDGKVITDSHERRRSHEATRLAEKAAGLSLYQPQSENRGHLHELRQSVDRAIASAGGDITRFKSLLEAQGLKLVENRSATTGRLSGIGYEDAAGRLWKGSSLGKYYSAAGLQRSGLDLGYEAGKPKAKDQQQGREQGGKQGAAHEAGQAARASRLGADLEAPAGSSQVVGGASKNEVRNMLRGREGLGLSQGQKDRLRKKHSRQNDWEM